MNNLTSDEDGDCSPYTSDSYIAVTILSSCTGAISAIASLLVISGIFVTKKHLFFIQRLIFYLSTAVLLNSLSVVLRLQRVAALGGRSVEHLHPLCVLTAFIDQTTSWSTLIAICCITSSLLVNVVLLRSVETLEKVYIALIFGVPLLFNWIPFINESYGEAGAWCWIRNKDEDCQNFGNSLRFILWYIPLYVVLVILIAVYIVILYRVRKLQQHWDGKFDPSSKHMRDKMRKEFRPLIWYPLIYLILGVFPTINRIHGAFISEPSLTLWILHALFSPLRGGFIALAYALDGQTVRRLLSDHSVVCTVLRWGPGTTRHIKEYPSIKTRSDSNAANRTAHNNNSHSNNNADLQTEYIPLSVVCYKDIENSSGSVRSQITTKL